MNTMPTMIQPARAPEPSGGKSQDAGAQSTPFNQVLSSEMANQRNAQAARQEADRPRAADAGARAAAPAEADASEAAAPAELAPPAEAVTETVVPDAATLLGLAVAPAAVPAPPVNAGAEADEAESPETLVQAFDTGTRKNRPGTSRTAPEAGVPGAATSRGELAVPGKAAPQVAAAALQAAQAPAAATALQDAAKPGDSSFDAILHPALRAAAQGQHAVSARLDVEAAQPRLAPAVGSSAWGQALGERIVWMAGAAQQTATLTLNPPNLGPLQVVLNISNDQAVANFFAAQPEVRQALESAFPRLREMMGEAGIQLDQATVSADSSPQQQDQAAGRPGQGSALRAGGMDETSPAQPAVTVPLRAGRGLVDTFA